MKVEDYDDFEEVLAEAEINAVTPWEMDFVADLKEKYEEFKGKTFLSDKQVEVLEKIAGL